MRIAILGAGAVGGNFAVRLALAGERVSVVARGAGLEAMQANGALTLLSGDQVHRAALRATDDAAELGIQDVVISTTKATDPAGLATTLAPIVGAQTRVVFAQNGIPWWYPSHAPHPAARAASLAFLDPGGALRDLVPLEQVIGGVISSSNAVIEPGVVRNLSPERNRLHLGRPDDARDDTTLDDLRARLRRAGIESPPIADIRDAIWGKLTLNISSSIISLLTGHRLTILQRDERLGRLCLRTAGEAMAIARAQGADTRDIHPEVLLDSPTDHLPSLRQDYDRGRTLELDALVRAPLALAASSGIETPTLDALAALAFRMGVDAGLYVEHER